VSAPGLLRPVPWWRCGCGCGSGPGRPPKTLGSQGSWNGGCPGGHPKPAAQVCNPRCEHAFWPSAALPVACGTPLKELGTARDCRDLGTARDCRDLGTDRDCRDLGTARDWQTRRITLCCTAHVLPFSPPSLETMHCFSPSPAGAGCHTEREVAQCMDLLYRRVHVSPPLPPTPSPSHCALHTLLKGAQGCKLSCLLGCVLGFLLSFPLSFSHSPPLFSFLQAEMEAQEASPPCAS